MKKFRLTRSAIKRLIALFVGVCLLTPEIAKCEEHSWFFEIIVKMAKYEKLKSGANCCQTGHCPMGVCTGTASLPCCPRCCTESCTVPAQVSSCQGCCHAECATRPCQQGECTRATPCPTGIVSGLTPSGTFTPDQGIPINPNNYSFSIPAFSGYPLNQVVGTVVVRNDESRAVRDEDRVFVGQERTLQEMKLLINQLTMEVQLLRMQLQVMQPVQPVQYWAPVNGYAPVNIAPTNHPSPQVLPYPMMLPMPPVVPTNFQYGPGYPSQRSSHDGDKSKTPSDNAAIFSFYTGFQH